MQLFGMEIITFGGASVSCSGAFMDLRTLVAPHNSPESITPGGVGVACNAKHFGPYPLSRPTRLFKMHRFRWSERVVQHRSNHV